MNIVVTVDSNWAIGSKGDLFVSIPNERKMFRELTEGKVIVYGRKTLRTFPQGLPLMNRTNIILSRDKNYKVRGAKVVGSVEELLEEIRGYRTEDVFVVGGESVYRQLLPYCDVAHVTAIDNDFAADAYFNNLDKNDEWQMTADSDEMTYFDLPYTFIKYERKKS